MTREEVANARHLVSFGCDLEDAAPPGLSVQRWDDVPAVSEDLNVACNVIVARLMQLVTQCQGERNATPI